MYGASAADVPPVRWAMLRSAVSVVLRLPVAGSSRYILIPVHQEPKLSHHRPAESTKRFGSIALWSSLVVVCTTMPWFVQLPGSPVVLVARKIAELREPSDEAA